MSIFKTVSGQGPDVVVLHGWGCSHQHMQPVVDQLTDRYCVHNIDLPGLGQSSWDESIQSIADIADQLLPHLPERAIYIGWSFGGLVATSIASRFSERVSRIIGLSTLPKFIEADGWPAVPKPGFYPLYTQGLASMSVSAFFNDYYNNEFKSIQPKPKRYHQLCAIPPLIPKQ